MFVFVLLTEAAENVLITAFLCMHMNISVSLIPRKGGISESKFLITVGFHRSSFGYFSLYHLAGYCFSNQSQVLSREEKGCQCGGRRERIWENNEWILRLIPG